MIPLGDGIQDLARKVLKICLAQNRPIPLRSLDGIHLASALAAHQSEMVTADRRMQQAAQALGFKLQS